MILSCYFAPAARPRNTEVFAHCGHRVRTAITHILRGSCRLDIPVREELKVRENIHRERKSREMIDPSEEKGVKRCRKNTILPCQK